MKTSLSLVLVYGLTLVKVISAKIYFTETFDNEASLDRFVYSKHEGKEYGKFELSPGKFYDDQTNKGLKTTEDARFYAISSKFEDSKFDRADKDLILQFSVKHEQNIDCGGGYLKLFDCKLDQEQMHGDSEYSVMFGPDICGPATRKVHVIFNYKGKNHLISKDIRCKDDELTHLYRLHVKQDNTYKVYIDGEVTESGDLSEDFQLLAPKKIKDPNAKKPEDWDDREEIDDPEDKKPDDWDVPELIPDPEATKPADWDEEMDGEFQAPQISNPAYKGKWSPKKIKNPDYKGVWVHPEIDNPEYEADDKLYQLNRQEICAVGIDVWQVKSGSIFDNILISDDEKEADAEAETILKKMMEGEKKMKKEFDEAEKAKAAAEAEKAKEDEDSKLDDSKDEDADDNDVETDEKPNAKDEL